MTILRERLASKTVDLYNAKNKGETPQAENTIVIHMPTGFISKKYKVSSNRKLMKVKLSRSSWLRSNAARQVKAALEEISKLEGNLERYYLPEVFGQSNKKKAIDLQEKIVEAFEVFRISNIITYLEVSGVENNRLNLKVFIPKMMDTYESEFKLYSFASELEKSEDIIINLDIHIDKNRA